MHGNILRLSSVALLTAALISIPGLAGALGGVLNGNDPDATDPARGIPLTCGQIGVPGPLPQGRSNHVIEHVANVCGVVGTDIEFQSRKDANGVTRDYAFVGTMGSGFQIYDITNPLIPVHVGGTNDTGWQNDVQVRGNFVVSTFDGVSGEPSTGSTCLKTNFPGSNDQGVDIFRLTYNPALAALPVPAADDIHHRAGGLHVRREPAGRRAQRDHPPERQVARHLEPQLRLGGRRDRPAAAARDAGRPAAADSAAQVPPRRLLAQGHSLPAGRARHVPVHRDGAARLAGAR